MTQRRYRYRDRIDVVKQRKNRSKSRVRAKGEHPFLVLKRIFGFAKVRYRGIAKNAERLSVPPAAVAAGGVVSVTSGMSTKTDSTW